MKQCHYNLSISALYRYDLSITVT